MNLGLFQVADNEAEVMGILAHEIGHVVGRHGAEQIMRGAQPKIQKPDTKHTRLAMEEIFEELL